MLGIKGKGSAWAPEKKPTWWNEEHWRFESPNNGTPRMGVEALDAILSNCILYYKRLREGEWQTDNN